MSDSSMPWVKLYTEMLDDTKLGRIGERARWRFVQLMLMAGECDAEGYLVNGDRPMSTDDIAWRLRLEPSKCAADMSSLENIGLVSNTPNGWCLPKFSARQGRSQSEKREKWRENQARKRLNKSGPEWETSNMTDVLTPVINDSPVSHHPREEKRREEKSNTPAPTPAQAVEPDPVKELAAVFEKSAGIKLPTPAAGNTKARKQVGAIWWNPLKEMVRMADGSAAERLRETIKQMRRDGLTLSSPKSVLNVFTSLNGAALSDEPVFKPGTVYT